MFKTDQINRKHGRSSDDRRCLNEPDYRNRLSYLDFLKKGDYGLFKCKICKSGDSKPVHIGCFNIKEFRSDFRDYCIDAQSTMVVMLVDKELVELFNVIYRGDDNCPSSLPGDLNRYRRMALQGCGVCAFTSQLPLDVVKIHEATDIAHTCFMIDDDIEFFHEAGSTIGYYPFLLVYGMGSIMGYIREDVNPNVINTSESWKEGSRTYVDLTAVASKVASDPIATYDRTICVRNCYAGLDLAVANLVDIVFSSRYIHHIEIVVSQVWWNEPRTALVLGLQDYNTLRAIDKYRDFLSFESTGWRDKVEVCFSGKYTLQTLQECMERLNTL